MTRPIPSEPHDIPRRCTDITRILQPSPRKSGSAISTSIVSNTAASHTHGASGLAVMSSAHIARREDGPIALPTFENPKFLSQETQESLHPNMA